MNRLLGSTLIIIGTSVGGGMLGLPIATAHCGFLGALALFVFCWLFMTLGACLIIEVNLWFPSGTNMITMAKKTLGPKGHLLMWCLYLALLYSLLAAYTASGNDVLHDLLQRAGWHLSLKSNVFLFMALFGVVVVAGIRYVDMVNRSLMSAKLIVYAALVIFLLPKIHSPALHTWHPTYLSSAMAIVITSFGFGHILPSLREYLQDNVRDIKRAIWIGSSVPFFVYVLWIIATMGVLPRYGAHGLLAMQHAAQPVSELANALALLSKSTWVNLFAHVFVSICVATSFLSVALGLSDCLADGLHWPKHSVKGVGVYLLTFLPPLVLVVAYPDAFLLGLRYAGIFCVALLVLLPALMAWAGRGRYQSKAIFQLKGGTPMLGLLILLSIFVITLAAIYPL
ncbi:MAG: tryptophan/tyrosine permease [marine bacterium B5-7]|nr:MAG: tryptophan/tyrosine permease [marine bacterium B5-7]